MVFFSSFVLKDSSLVPVFQIFLVCALAILCHALFFSCISFGFWFVYSHSILLIAHAELSQKFVDKDLDICVEILPLVTWSTFLKVFSFRQKTLYLLSWFWLLHVLLFFPVSFSSDVFSHQYDSYDNLSAKSRSSSLFTKFHCIPLGLMSRD